MVGGLGGSRLSVARVLGERPAGPNGEIGRLPPRSPTLCLGVPEVISLTGESTPPDEELLLDEKHRVVRDVIEQMPGKLSETLILAYYHRFAYKDIGEVVGIPLGTVKSRLHAAVAWFAEHYKQAVAEQMKHRMPERIEDQQE